MTITYIYLFADQPENVQLKTSVIDGKTCRGETIRINCSADAVPSMTSYELFENDTVIMDTSGMWSRTLSSGGVFVYKCVANNSLGSTGSESVAVTVNGKQSFLLKTEYDKDIDMTTQCFHEGFLQGFQTLLKSMLAYSYVSEPRFDNS